MSSNILALAIAFQAIFTVDIGRARTDGAVKKGTSPPPHAAAVVVRKAVDRRLASLESDAVNWRKDRQCSTCHHGTMTVWALSDATRG